MKTNRLNKSDKRHGKALVRRFKYLPGLLLIILLVGLSLVFGACTAGTTAPTSSGTTTPGSTSGMTTGSTVAPTITESEDNEEPASVLLIDADEALQILKDNPDAVLLDVRTEQEFVGGHITGAVLIPVDEINARLSELPEDKNTPIIVYCRSGNRSATAAQMLVDAGYRSVYDLGGIISWPYEIVK